MEQLIPQAVFISYARGSAQLDSNVIKLADSLNAQGINCDIDQYESAPMEGWPKWMTLKADNATFVLVVASQKYHDTFMGISVGGKGVPYESTNIINELFDMRMKNNKFIPIVFDHNDISFIVPPLRGYNYYDLSMPEGFENLIRRLTNQPLVTKPALGQARPLKKQDTGKDLYSIPDNAYSQDVGADEEDGGATTTLTAIDTQMMQVELHIDKDPESWTSLDVEKLIAFLRNNVGIMDIKIKGVRKGSIYVNLEMSARDYLKLMAALEDGRLAEIDVLGATGKATKRFADQLVGLTVKEVNELAKILKSEYGIEPAAAAIAVAAGPGSPSNPAKDEEKTSFNVVLKNSGANKLNVVKIIKDLTGLGLKEAKDLVDGAPSPLKEGLSKEEAETLTSQLKDAGADAEIQ